MIGRFTETEDLEKIESHLLQGRIMFVFTGEAFITVSYNAGEKRGITKGYSLSKNMDLEAEVKDLSAIVENIRNNIEGGEHHYLLYYGELTEDNPVTDFMREFYNPSEELPLIVATAVEGPENVNVGVTHPGNINGKSIEYVNEFLEVLMDKYLTRELLTSKFSSHNIISLWLVKDEEKYKVELRSRYLDKIVQEEELKNYRDLIIAELNLEMMALGVPVMMSSEYKSSSNF